MNCKETRKPLKCSLNWCLRAFVLFDCTKTRVKRCKINFTSKTKRELQKVFQRLCVSKCIYFKSRGFSKCSLMKCQQKLKVRREGVWLQEGIWAFREACRWMTFYHQTVLLQIVLNRKMHFVELVLEDILYLLLTYASLCPQLCRACPFKFPFPFALIIK